MTLRVKFRQPSTTALPSVFAALRNLGARMFGKPRRARRLELIETLPLGGRRQLLLITCNGQSYLVGAGADSVSTILPAAHAESISSASADLVSADLLNRPHPESSREGSLLQ